MSAKNWAEYDSDDDKEASVLASVEDLTGESHSKSGSRNNGQEGMIRERSLSQTGSSNSGERSNVNAHAGDGYIARGGGLTRGGRDNRDRDRDSYNDRDRGDRGPPPPRNISKPLPTNPPFVAYVGNLKFDMSENDIGDFFYSGGCDIEKVDVHLDQDGRPKGFALIEFSNQESLKTALLANGVDCMGRAIRVDVHDVRPKDRRQGPGDFGGRDSGYGGRDGRRCDPPIGPADLSTWERKANPPLPPVASEKRAPVRRESTDNSGRSSYQERTERSASTTPAVRKVIAIQPRSQPIENIGKPVTAAASIFGEGKAVDVLAAEQAIQKRKVEREAAEAAAAAVKAAAEAETKALAKASQQTEKESESTTDTAEQAPKMKPLSPSKGDQKFDSSKGQGTGRGRGGRFGPRDERGPPREVAPRDFSKSQGPPASQDGEVRWERKTMVPGDTKVKSPRDGDARGRGGRGGFEGRGGREGGRSREDGRGRGGRKILQRDDKPSPTTVKSISEPTSAPTSSAPSEIVGEKNST